jgi:hypothetical protein
VGTSYGILAILGVLGLFGVAAVLVHGIVTSMREGWEILQKDHE